MDWLALLKVYGSERESSCELAKFILGDPGADSGDGTDETFTDIPILVPSRLSAPWVSEDGQGFNSAVFVTI